jgi:hypothetical protein
MLKLGADWHNQIRAVPSRRKGHLIYLQEHASHMRYLHLCSVFTLAEGIFVRKPRMGELLLKTAPRANPIMPPLIDYNKRGGGQNRAVPSAAALVAAEIRIGPSSWV